MAVFAVGREDLHARHRRHLDARLLLKALPVEHRDIVLAANGYPDFLAVWREERLVRRAADIGRVLDRIGGGIDEGDRVAADRDHRGGLWIGPKTNAVNQQLALVHRTQIARRRT